MQPITNLIDAVRQFRLTRRYDFPVLFFLLQTIVTLTKFSFLLAIFGAGYLFIQKHVTPEQHYEALAVNTSPAIATDSIAISDSAPTVTEPSLAAAISDKPVIGTTTHAEPIAPDSAIALLLAKLDQTRSDAANHAENDGTNQEVHYRARIQWTNVRRAPSAAAPIIVSLDTTQQVRIVMQKGSWVQIQSDEIDTKDGYVLASLLEPVDRAQ